MNIVSRVVMTGQTALGDILAKPKPFSPEHRARKFSAVLGVTSSKRLKLTRPVCFFTSPTLVTLPSSVTVSSGPSQLKHVLFRMLSKSRVDAMSEDD